MQLAVSCQKEVHVRRVPRMGHLRRVDLIRINYWNATVMFLHMARGKAESTPLREYDLLGVCHRSLSQFVPGEFFSEATFCGHL